MYSYKKYLKLLSRYISILIYFNKAISYCTILPVVKRSYELEDYV